MGHTNRKMKWLFFVISISLCIFALTQGSALRKQEQREAHNDDTCLGCVEAVMLAIEHCSDAGTPAMECMLWVMGATSECVRCICDVIEIIDEGNPDACNWKNK